MPSVFCDAQSIFLHPPLPSHSPHLTTTLPQPQPPFPIILSFSHTPIGLLNQPEIQFLRQTCYYEVYLLTVFYDARFSGKNHPEMLDPYAVIHVRSKIWFRKRKKKFPKSFNSDFDSLIFPDLVISSCKSV